MLRLLAAAASLVASAATAQPLAWAQDCGLEPPGSVVRPPVPTRPFERPWSPGEPPLVRRESPAVPRMGYPAPRLSTGGALAGKTVYLSAGHGFTWTVALNPDAWRTQRGNTHDIVEDLVSTETVSQWLLPMLLNAGARVVTVREADLQTRLVTVDDGSPGYAEVGPGFSDSTLPGWGTPASPMSGATLPFQLGKNRLLDAAPTATASATWTAQVPADGEYAVYVSWTSFSSRVTDAHYVVRHAGGDTHFRVNQRRHGGTWVLLGRFYFRRAVPAQVVAHNDSKDVGQLSLDAVRLGGGMGLVDRGAGVSGRPRFEESARYGTQYSGAPLAVFGPNGDDRTDDIGSRSRFAAWVHEPGEDAVYLSWHTNAFNGTAVGTDVYVYGPNPPDGTYQFTGTAGSDLLAQAVHRELINDIRADAGWNQPTWRDRGINSAYFGELNPSNNSEMPAILMEIAFHDAAADAAHLKQAGFRYLAARAITQGVVRYFATKDGVTPRFSPEPPTHVAAAALPGGQALVRWRAPPLDTQGVGGAAAQRYRVYQSSDGLGWDDGFEVATTTFTTALPEGAARFFRVTALNDGGESFPSEVVGTRAPSAGQAPVLVVNAYDRLDSGLNGVDALSAWSLGNVERVFVQRMNDGAAVVRHGDAWSFVGQGFDSATVAAVLDGDVQLSPYVAVDWAAGRGHPGGQGPSAAEQALLQAYAQAGGGLLFSGSKWPSALQAQGAPAAPFLGQLLRAASPGGLGAAPVSAVAGTFLDGLPGLGLDDGKQGAYLVGPTDVVSAVNGASVVARFAGGEGAGLAWGGKVVALTFPFEVVVGRNARLELLGRAATELGLLQQVPPLPDAGVEPEPDGGTVPTLPLLLDALPADLPAVKGGCGCAQAQLWPLLGPVLLLLLRSGRRRRR